MTGAARTALAELADARFLERLLARDPTLFKSGSAHLGWPCLPDAMAAGLGGLRSFAAEARRGGVDAVVLFGAGSASPACGALAGPAPLKVLDDFGPEALPRVDPRRTLFVAAAASGFTEEIDAQLAWCLGALSKAGLKPEDRLVAAAEPGSALEKLARRLRVRKVFLNPPGARGAFAALSHVGLVPAALAGADVGRVLTDARALSREPASALELGASLAQRARAGRALAPITAPPALAPWIEGLFGRAQDPEGRGVVPIVQVGGGSGEVGRALFLWQVAAAAAGFLLGIDPFERRDGRLSPASWEGLGKPSLRAGGLAAWCDGGLAAALRGTDLPLADVLRGHLGRAKAGEFIAVSAWLDEDPDLPRLRERLSAAAGLPVLLPAGSLRRHGAGDPRGLYLQLTAPPAQDAAVPGRPYTLGALRRALAAEDFAAAAGAGRRILRLELGPSGANSIKACINALGGE